MRAVPRRPLAAALTALSLVLLLGGAPGVPALALDLSTPAGQLQAMRRIQCSEEDGKPVTYWWKGETYSRVPGEPDRLLFLVEGMNVRQCGPLPGADGGFRMTSREVLLYKDPQTGEVLRRWQNPWTGQSVEVLHIANDPVNFSYQPVRRDGSPASFDIAVLGNQWWFTNTVPLFYRNPLGGDYQQYIGGTYHATEMFNFFGDVDDLTHRRRPSAEVRVGWVRMSGWLPWMEMGDRVGVLYFHTAGRKLDSWDELSDVMKAEIAANYPEYREPPPLSDDRPNETSWTYFKKILEGRKTQ